jgi:hypothetical protein
VVEPWPEVRARERARLAILLRRKSLRIFAMSPKNGRTVANPIDSINILETVIAVVTSRANAKDAAGRFHA